MHLSMQSPTPPPPPPHPGKGGDLSQRGCKRRTPGVEILDNPPLTPYYSPDGYPGKAANNVKLPLQVVYRACIVGYGEYANALPLGQDSGVERRSNSLYYPGGR